MQMPEQINIQGHRGARGHLPENTLEGFIKAIDLGASTLEMDVVVSADRQLVVSHEAWMNDMICSLPGGEPIPPGKGRSYNLYRMTYAEIRTFDCGKRGHAGFPSQAPRPAFKPLLKEVFQTVEAHWKKNNTTPVSYNIEIKTEAEDGPFNPPAGEFAALIMAELTLYGFRERITLQSFDVRILRELQKMNSPFQAGLLVENEVDLSALNALGFMPQFYNPWFGLVSQELVEVVHAKGMKIIPWTVNEAMDMERLISMGVDGIITDYPDRLSLIVKQISQH
jgi:glycerophosphoryl diester phosphodiesterase